MDTEAPLEIDAQIVIGQYQQRLADVTHENIMLRAQIATLQQQAADAATPPTEE